MSSHSALLLALRADDVGAPSCAARVAGEPIVARVLGQLRSLGATSVTVVTRSAWREQLQQLVGDGAQVVVADDLVAALAAIEAAATHADGQVIVAQADVVTHTGSLAGLVKDPRVATGVLADVASGPRGRKQPRLRVSRGRVVAAESGFHGLDRGESRFLGVLLVSRDDLPGLLEVCRELAGILGDGVPDGWVAAHRAKLADWSRYVIEERTEDAALVAVLSGRDDVWGRTAAELADDLRADVDRRVIRPLEDLAEDPLPLLTVGLVRRDVVVGAAWVRELYWGRPTTADELDRAAAELERIDEDRVQLDSAVKASDGFFTTFFVSPYSKYIARWCARRGFTPNQVTTFSMLLGILAAACFATGRQPWMVVGAIVLQLAFTFDCVDGQLARYTRSFSKLGAWLDSVFDRGKEYVAYAGLAIGAVATGNDGSVWALATAALVVQTLRHFVDFSYAAQQHQALAVSVSAPLARPSETGPTRWERLEDDAPRTFLQRVGASAIRASHAAESRAWMKWGKRAFVLPIGERFALISVTAAVWGAEVTFAALLVWGSLAAAYTVSGRVARSLV